MPLKGDKDISAEEAIEQGLCPECGQDLKATSAIGHRNAHWRTQPVNGRDGDEARKRMALLDKYIADNKIVTSDVAERAAQTAAAKS